MGSWQQEPEVGQKFWHEGIGSGTIEALDFKEHIVYVNFYEKGHSTYEWDDVVGHWDDCLGGTWMIYNL